MKYYWFGDSWVVGDELERSVPMDLREHHTFARLVSNQFNAVCVNLGVSGSGPDSIPYEFNKIVDDLNVDDTVFFCLSASHRIAVLNEQGIPHQIIPGPNHSLTAHEYTNMWYKYFDTEPHRLYNYDRTISLLYLWCLHAGIKCYFMNLFTTEIKTMINVVPESSWLVPRTNCLAEFILPKINNKDGLIINSDYPGITTEDWKLQKAAKEKYIDPNCAHPNLAGHRKIAEELIKLLDAKTK